FARLSVRGLSATERYRQNRPLAVDFDHRRSIEGEKGKKKKKKKKKKRKRRKKKKRRRNTLCRPRPHVVAARELPVSHPRPHAVVACGQFSPTWGERSRRCCLNDIVITNTLSAGTIVVKRKSTTLSPMRRGGTINDDGRGGNNGVDNIC
ncbi:hypothetical protein GW17_00057434, partial [Ensete ventricosum]